MVFYRRIAPQVPRSFSRLNAFGSRRLRTTNCVIPPSWSHISSPHAAQFSTSRMWMGKGGDVDAELITKFESEISMEKEIRDEDEVPTSVKEYLQNGPFEVQDVPGQEEVVLTRTFGDEKIRITFSVADLNTVDPESDFEDRAMTDEDDVNHGNIGQGVAKISSEDALNPNNNDSSDREEDAEASYPARVNVVIEKPGKGALAVETVAQDGMIVIDNVFYYTDAAYAHASSADEAHARQNLYVGPPFGNLDEDLQVLLERYLDERGINTALALFVPDYIDMKEQQEYLRWLSNVKSFVEA